VAGPIDTTLLMRRVDRLLDRGASLPNGSAEQIEVDISAFELLDRVLEVQGVPRAALIFPEITEPKGRKHSRRRLAQRNAVKTRRERRSRLAD
jgi:hypothetical protein